jgi:hypothetical protein
MCQRRVMARIKGEVRQVQVCKWTTLSHTNRDEHEQEPEDVSMHGGRLPAPQDPRDLQEDSDRGHGEVLRLLRAAASGHRWSVFYRCNSTITYISNILFYRCNSIITYISNIILNIFNTIITYISNFT